MELYALRSKLNPHFIFNTFNSIQFFINNNEKDLSERYLILLSKHIRNVFDYSHLQSITLEKEISLLKDYLDIEKIRFGNKVNTEILIDPRLNITSTYIPSMIVQPHVENSFAHGLFHKTDVGYLKIELNYIDGYTYQVKIIDDGIGFIEDDSKKVSSTQVIKERIHLINQSGDFHVKKEKQFLNENKKDKGTVIILTISHEQSY
jgi:LytS/YehU family sensor histidine kinase